MMKKEEPQQVIAESLSDIHRNHGLPLPAHPLISLIDGTVQQIPLSRFNGATVPNFYQIAYKPGLGSRVKYGQGYYDFSEGGMLFAAPNQVIGNCATDADETCTMYTLLIHPDFLWNYPLAKK